MKKKDSSGKETDIQKSSKEDIDNLFKTHNIKLENDVGYDAVYVYHMAKADFFGTSIVSDRHLLQYVKDVLDDVDGYDGLPMTRFYADCIGSGTPIM